MSPCVHLGIIEHFIGLLHQAARHSALREDPNPLLRSAREERALKNRLKSIRIVQAALGCGKHAGRINARA
ncbi:MAG: hypothetical protein A3G27_01690 [Betaproteobacteria bacterium RIFCSPLOWO2_12_FULL_66_14]|nr:MAG: hypothetical protein A3G27_01690 [Betaproteobacteria bacterium RIFCSPLOWO2_12_FULL_66_14]